MLSCLGGSSGKTAATAELGSTSRSATQTWNISGRPFLHSVVKKRRTQISFRLKVAVKQEDKNSYSDGSNVATAWAVRLPPKANTGLLGQHSTQSGRSISRSTLSPSMNPYLRT